MRGRVLLTICVLLLASCEGASVRAPSVTSAPVETGAAPIAVPVATPTAPAQPTAEPRRYAKLRVFVASENTDSVVVLEGAPDGSYAQVGRIAVGRLPHQMAVSPDGRFVAVNNRMANTTSVIDPIAMKEIARISVGKQPHGIIWSPDSRVLFVAHERDNYISRFEAGTWKSLGALMVGVPQHVLIFNSARPNELWFTVTNSTEADHLRVYDLDTKKVTRVKVDDVHDAYFTPDGSEIWSSSSGFLEKPSDRMVIYDPVARKVKQELRLPGRYPFHTLKTFQDGVYHPENQSVMVLSDHIGPSLVWLDWRERRILSETKLGGHPFHSTYDPEGGRLLVTTNVDGMVNVIDMKTRQVVQKLPVTKAHGIASVGIAAP
ncbi:MAG TPA: cytochrome D1 domain-containing protein [Candidatus Limnocylindria bacterium]|nr:cytochrome D1 domain-containing protein [Candidatus Limnocylindria bacterium]